MRTARKYVDLMVNTAMVAMFIVIFAVVLYQIFMRYILGSPLVWSEELSRFIFIWVSLVGWVQATRSGTHIRITFVEERLPAVLRKFLGFFFKLCNLGFLAALVWLGILLVAAPNSRRSAVTLDISMGLFYAALPVSALLCMFYVVHDLLNPGANKNAPAVME